MNWILASSCGVTSWFLEALEASWKAGGNNLPERQPSIVLFSPPGHPISALSVLHFVIFPQDCSTAALCFDCAPSAIA